MCDVESLAFTSVCHVPRVFATGTLDRVSKKRRWSNAVREVSSLHTACQQQQQQKLHFCSPLFLLVSSLTVQVPTLGLPFPILSLVAFPFLLYNLALSLCQHTHSCAHCLARALCHKLKKKKCHHRNYWAASFRPAPFSVDLFFSPFPLPHLVVEGGIKRTRERRRRREHREYRKKQTKTSSNHNCTPLSAARHSASRSISSVVRCRWCFFSS